MTSLAAPGRLRGLSSVVLASICAMIAVGLTAVVPVAVVVGLTLGAIGAIAVVLDRRWALTAVAAFTVLRLPEVATEFHGAPSLFLPLMGLVALTLGIEWAQGRSLPIGGASPLVIIGVFLMVAAVTLIGTPGASDSITTLRSIAEDGSVAVLVGLLLRDTASLRRLSWVLVAGGGLLATLSLVHFSTGAWGTAFGGLSQSAVQQIVGTTDDVRVSGPIGDPNFYAQWLVMLIPFAVDRFWDETRRALRFAALYSTATMVATVVVTFSRGALLGLGVVAMALVIRRRPPVRGLVAAGLLLAVVLPFAPSGYVDRIAALGDVGTVQAGIDPSVRSRTAELTAGWRMFLSNPISGVGYGEFTDNYLPQTRDLGIDLRATPREAHNLYMQFAAEMGLIGLALLAGIAVTVTRALRRGRRRFRGMFDATGDGIGYAAAVSLLAYAATSMFLHLDLARLPWLVVGIALALPSVARFEDESRQLAVSGGAG